MGSLFNSSIFVKLLITILLATLLPIATISIAYFTKGKEAIIENTLDEIGYLSSRLSQNLGTQLQDVRRDLQLISTYEIFDDILAGDIDRRIALFFGAKQSHLGIKGTYYAMDLKGTVVASTQTSALGKPFAFKTNKRLYSLGKQTKAIIMIEPVFASFDPTQQVGHVAFIYDAQNLTDMSLVNPHSHTFIFNAFTGDYYGMKPMDLTGFAPGMREGFYFTDELILSYRPLKFKELGEGFYFVQALERDYALSFYEEFSDIIFYAIVLGLLLVGLLGSMMVRIISRPIDHLTATAKKISDEKDYSIRVTAEGSDEIAALGNTMNQLLETVETMIEKTRNESEQRLQVLTKLVDMLNAITQQTSNEDTTETATRLVSKFLDEEVFILVNETTIYQQYPIEYYDARTKEPVIYGYLSFERKKRSLLEETLLGSIATMVSLQIERMMLVEQTHAASEAKSTFISSMSHELRTPLNAILGYSQIIKSIGEDKQKRMGENILTAGQHLLSMINDILDIAKIEAGKMEAHIQSTPVDKLLEEVKILTQRLAEDKGLSFTVELESPFTLETDPKLLKQILVNQISNSVKFTESGGITMKVRNDGHHAFFDIQDTGIGISEENLGKLFNEFTQIDNHLQQKQKGTGLGLVLSKQFAKLLGGDLTLSSVEGEGTTAHVSVALNTQQETPDT